MADQKRWFKVWTSIVANGVFAEMPLEDIGRWALLGAATALDGDSGVLTVPGEGRELCRLLRVTSLDAARSVLQRLQSVTFEEGKNRHGGDDVTVCIKWRNWRKYQEDSTATDRKRRERNRHGLRGEEKRREEKRKTENPGGPRDAPPPAAAPPPSGSNAEAREVLAWLNEKAGRNYRTVDVNVELIRARLRTGLTVSQLKAIVSRKVREWKGDPKTERWLRPATLFGKTKCEQYVGELPAVETPDAARQ